MELERGLEKGTQDDQGFRASAGPGETRKARLFCLEKRRLKEHMAKVYKSGRVCITLIGNYYSPSPKI